MVVSGLHSFGGRLPLVVFPSLTATRPKAATASWDELVRRFSRHAEREEKDGAGWSPTVYKPGTTRANESVELVTMLTLDFDHTEPPWELLAPYSYVAATTFSHRAGDPHWRVVIPLAAAVEASNYPDFWERAHYHLAPNADDSCKDASRFYWWPSCRPGAPRDSRSNGGAWLQPASLPALPVLPPRPTSPRAEAAAGRPGDDFNRRGNVAALLDAHGWRLVYDRHEEGYWRRPGKARGTISATTNYRGSGLFYCFSSNAAPFESHTPYDPFSVYTLLEHGGDFKEAAKALAKQGYGDPLLARDAKAVTAVGAAGRNGLHRRASPDTEPPRSAKAATKGVTHPADSLSEDARLSGAVWEALGCRLGSTVVPEQVTWLWQNRVALGKFNLLEGDGGEGKSLLLCDLAARITANKPMPDGSPNPFGEPRRVVLMMAEDGDADTIAPRIIAAGGDMRYVVLLKEVPDEEGGHFPTVPDDIPHIWHVCKTAGAAALLIDPGASYLSAEVNSHNDHSVRRALARFPEMAADVGMAILWVRHLNKNTAAEAKHRGGGSGAFLNLARTALAVGVSPDDDTGTRRVLAVNKINLDVQDASWAYHPETVYVPKDEHSGEQVKTVRLVWEGKSTFTAADILTAKPDPEERSAGEVCKQMLLELLAERPHPERVVWQALQQARVSESTYRRVRRTLNVQTWREGGVGDAGHWVLSLTPRDEPKAVTPPAGDGDSLSKRAPLPDRGAPPPAAKVVTRMSDTHSDSLRLVAGPWTLCDNPAHAGTARNTLGGEVCGTCHPAPFRRSA